MIKTNDFENKIAALAHAKAISLSRRARVNSISPSWIDTMGSNIVGSDALQQPVSRVGKPEDIAALALFLCSDTAGYPRLFIRPDWMRSTEC